jgi:maleate isomerase
LVAAVQRLADVRADVVAFARTAAAFVGGTNGEPQTRELIASTSGAPGVTTSGGLIEALADLGAARVAVATLYDRRLSEDLRSFSSTRILRWWDFHALGLTDPFEVASLNSGQVTERVLAADRHRAKAVLLRCTNLPIADLLAPLSERLGKAVLSSNSVTVWAAMRAAGVAADAASNAC